MDKFWKCLHKLRNNLRNFMEEMSKRLKSQKRRYFVDLSSSSRSWPEIVVANILCERRYRLFKNSHIKLPVIVWASNWNNNWILAEDLWKKNWIIRKSNFGPNWAFANQPMVAAYWCKGQDEPRSQVGDQHPNYAFYLHRILLEMIWFARQTVKLLKREAGTTALEPAPQLAPHHYSQPHS